MRPISSHALYLDLLQDLGRHYGDDHSIYPWDSLSVAIRKALASSFVKKFADDVDSRACEVKAFDKFVSVNERCGTWHLNIRDLRDEMLVGALKKHLYNFFHVRETITGEFAETAVSLGHQPLVHSFSSILDEGRNGPGSSVGSESTDFYTKLFDSKLSCTSNGLRRAYTNYIATYPLWQEAEETRRNAWGDSSVVEGNRLHFVPKDATISRSICVEPGLNMFYQLGLGSILSRRLNDVFKVDLEHQPEVNRELARIGSETGALATIDLASASDSMSMTMVREFFPPSIVQWLEALRSPVSNYGSERIVLNMVSTMGNGFTFPLQTILFSCVVAACYEIDDFRRVDSPHDRRNLFTKRLPNWSVFGDDIICSERSFSKVTRLLELLGFEVNSNKTFNTGLFRESCGVDYLFGTDTRGVFCKTLRSPQDLYTLINLLNAWSCRTGNTLPKTIHRLLRSVPRLAVPPWENADCGIWAPERLLPFFRQTLRSKNGSLVYKRFIPKPVGLRIMEDKIHVPRGMKPRRYNAIGLYLAFLSGYITNGKILVRSDRVRYVTKWAVAPNWSYHPTAPNPFKGSVGGRGLESPELINLISAW